MEGNKVSDIKVLFPGYSELKGESIVETNGSCTLIKGPINCIIDTMTAWDGPRLLQALAQNHLSPEDINYVICTHGHSDHIGCNYLFKNAIHIVGYSISQGTKYFLSPSFSSGKEYKISDNIKVTPTPGHTLQDVSVIFQNDGKVYAITGDLFEKEEDLRDETIWMYAGSDNPSLQLDNREKILKIADYIIPGHGPMFEVPAEYRAN